MRKDGNELAGRLLKTRLRGNAAGPSAIIALAALGLLLAVNLHRVRAELKTSSNQVLSVRKQVAAILRRDQMGAARAGVRSTAGTESSSQTFSDIAGTWVSAPGVVREQAIIDRLSSVFRDAFEGLGLNPEQTRGVKDLFIERLQGYYDILQLAKKAGLSVEDVASLREQSDAEIDGKIRALVEPGAYPSLRVMLDDPAAFNAVENGYSVDFAFYGVPTTPGQNVKLALAVDSASKAALDASSNGGDVLSYSTVLTHHILSKASRFLSGQQMNILEDDLTMEAAARSGSKS